MRMSKFESPRLQGVLTRFTKYLNGPLGGIVMDKLEEGESFILQTADYVLRVSKKDCRAVVEHVNQPVDPSLIQE